MTRTRTALALALALLIVPGVAAADDENDDSPQPVTWVRFVNVRPGHSEDFVKLIMEARGEVLDNLMEEGHVLSWGVFVPFNRDADTNWTHGIWATYPDWSHMDQFIAAAEAADRELSEVERGRQERKFREIVELQDTHDIVTRRLAAPSAEMEEMPDGPPRYMRMGFYKVKPGHVDQAVALYNEYAAPTYEELIRTGAIYSAGLSAQELVTSDDWTLMSWSVLGSLAGVDAVDNAFETANEQRTEAEREAMMEAFMEHFEWEGYRSKIIRFIHLGGQGQGDGEHAAKENADDNAAETKVAVEDSATND
jgi:hypothetical protein